MSGPKYDSVTIEQRRLARERRERERKIRVQTMQNKYATSISNASSKITKLKEQIVAFKKQINEYQISTFSEFNEFENKVKSLETKLSSYPVNLTTEDEKELKNKQNDIDSFIASLNLSNDIKIVSDGITNKYSDKLMNEISDLSQKIREEEEKRKQELSQQKLLEEKQKQEEEQKVKIELEKAKCQIINQIQESLSEIDEYTYKPTEISEQFEKLKSEFTKLKNSPSLSIDYLKNFQAISVIPSITKYKKAIEEYQSFANSFNEKLTEYYILCQELNIPAKQYPISNDSLVYLQAEIDLLKERSEKAYNERYIQQSINEVMDALGYNIIGSMKEKPKGITESKLYQFNDETAISVTMDYNGDLCFEIGGMDDQDREPDTEESLALKEDMKKFCPKHQEIIDLLAEKGIILTRNHELPPDVEYAQVFNLNDFEINEKLKENLLRNDHKEINYQVNTQKHISKQN